MGLFTRLAPADVAEIAARFGLGAVARAIGIAAGAVNTTYRFETAAGPHFFVRVNEGKDEGDVAYEADLLAHLAAGGLPTPRPRAADDGRPYARVAAGWVTVFPWIEGEHRQGGAITAADAAQAGRALAQLHALGAGFDRRRESRYSFERMCARWRGLVAAGPPPEVTEALADVGEEIEWLGARAAARAALPQGIIHGDLFPDNVLFAGPRLAALLDFEQASDGALAYDLAVGLCSWCFDEGCTPDRASAMRAGYEAGRPLAGDERALLYVETRAAAMRFTVTRLTDVHLNPAASEELRAAKDFRRFHRRLRWLRDTGAEKFSRSLGL